MLHKHQSVVNIFNCQSVSIIFEYNVNGIVGAEKDQQRMLTGLKSICDLRAFINSLHYNLILAHIVLRRTVQTSFLYKTNKVYV